MLKSIIKPIYRWLKGREIVFDHNLANANLLMIGLDNATKLLRGVLKRYPKIAIGRKVLMRGRSKINLGHGSVINDYAVLDAIGINGITLGKSCNIGAYSIIKVSGTFNNLGLGIYFGDNVGIGDFSHIGGAGGVKIGSDTIVGAYFSIHPENHLFDDLEQPIRLQGVSRKGISVGNNCWIGAKVTLLDGASVGNGCIIAAGAVVRGTFPDNVIIGGVPARILKER